MSSLGVLRANQQFDLLVKEAESTKNDWEDRAVALKAIGDLGTPQSRAYLVKSADASERRPMQEQHALTR